MGKLFGMKPKSVRSGPAVKRVVPSAIRGNRKPSSKSKERLRIPPILFEGDEARSVISPVQEPAPAKFATGSAAASGRIEVELGELPQSYGTHKLLLLVRDPHWLYSHWDITLGQLQKYNALSTHKHLVLKVRESGRAEAAVQEIHVHPESRSWFVHVDRAETEYVAELGYYREDQSWVPVTVSESVVTPPESESQDRTVQFATMPPPPPVTPETQAAQTLVARRYALVQGELFQQNISGIGGLEGAVLSFESPGLLGEWTAAQDQRLAKEVHPYSLQCAQAGSIELLDLIGGSSLESISSQMAEQPGPEFWLNVNAELLIYGATKPDARLTLDGQPVVLAPDGTFSFRILLPDGQYEARIQAVSVEGDSREVKLKFTRCTEWR